MGTRSIAKTELIIKSQINFCSKNGIGAFSVSLILIKRARFLYSNTKSFAFNVRLYAVFDQCSFRMGMNNKK